MSRATRCTCWTSLGLDDNGEPSFDMCRLHRAAPELLALLKRYIGDCAECAQLERLHTDDPDRYEETGCDTCIDATAVIAKAEGRRA